MLLPLSLAATSTAAQPAPKLTRPVIRITPPTTNRHAQGDSSMPTSPGHSYALNTRDINTCLSSSMIILALRPCTS
eukprot:5271817-Pleurochrysis_carterae.AAC.1